jgi:hypothetical protein
MRLEGGEKRLSSHIEAHAKIPFVWGLSDCLLFVSDAAVLICGKDPAEPARGKYENLGKAAALIKELRGTTENILDVHFKRINQAYAPRGDIVLKHRENGATFGIVYDGKAIYKTPSVGLVRESLKEVDYAWRVE